MASYLPVIIVLVALLLLPRWLPPLVVRLRMSLFTRINGREGLQMPNAELGASAFRYVYGHPAANGRSRGARLSNLFWYWLAPGPEMHQEHLEQGPRYDSIAQLTRSILAVPNECVERLVDKSVASMPSPTRGKPWRWCRLRDSMMPVWADFYYELVFGQEPTHEAQRLIVANANDVATALKCCGLRHMKKRIRLTEFICRKLAAGEFPHAFPAGFSLREQAYYLQGTFFNTAIVQMSEAMAHLLMAVAAHPPLQTQLLDTPDDDALYDRVIHETLRLYPLFGIAHRITSDTIEIDHQTIEPGSVVCFNYPAYHRLGFDDPEQFHPDRWLHCPVKDANHIPFGMPRNRPCPAMRIALMSMRRLTRRLLERYRFTTSASHTRSLPNRGPCLVIDRQREPMAVAVEKCLLLAMRVRDPWEETLRSVAQLILGTIMILDARRLRLCDTYFAKQDGVRCPVHQLARNSTR